MKRTESERQTENGRTMTISINHKTTNNDNFYPTDDLYNIYKETEFDCSDITHAISCKKQAWRSR